jgi:hypothetical protein
MIRKLFQLKALLKINLGCKEQKRKVERTKVKCKEMKRENLKEKHLLSITIQMDMDLILT